MDSETFERVRRAVGQLPGRLREVVVLRYLEEMPIMEVAQGLEISTNAVNTRLSRAREQLKDKLADIFAL
jgi:RNA polymerase sigma-70 factor (ECF subfamily)